MTTKKHTPKPALPITAETVLNLLNDVDNMQDRCERVEAALCRIIQRALYDEPLLELVIKAMRGDESERTKGPRDAD